ncbi:serine/threonine protein kinase [Streptomyces spiroverticillatus]|uniref:Serine/threonine protein kinase n=1 Tax=Streptomyces finlayi TaxID=67296 RepID=A0A918WUA0_9ACTN|nr:metallophosphoesterase [Streptomyces finlayi]GGZ99563.1 serine/threonine protein kinase [Streptomyces spiroverticillatus]GHC84242.1 serine/threonine protein kinase [Streptomyces finlayi]
MTQGAGQGPAVRTATLRDFRVPPYAQAPVATYDAEQAHPGEQALAEHSYIPVQETYGDVKETYAPVQEAYPPVPETHTPAQEAYAPVQETYEPEPPFDEGDAPEGYTPTQRDLPVITRDDRGPGDTLRIPQPDFAAQPDGEGLGPLFVVGDVHGYLVELLDALHEQGLIDDEGHWSAGNARLWFLGDFTDRGPDGIGVIDLVMRLSAEAAAAGGYCKALMGNHELLLLGARRFGDTPVNSGAGTATFQAAWLLNGGQKHDMERLQDVHLQWMARLDAVALEDGHLLTHSDTTAYLDYGSTIEDVNDTVHEILTRNDADECWDVFRKFTKRFAFRDEGGSDAVRELLAAYGGERIVHGHSPIPYLLGEVGNEDTSDGEGSSGPVVEGPHVYADSLAIAMDGGVTMAGKLLVVQLPLDD